MPDPYPEPNIDIVTKKKKKTGFYSLINTVIASMNSMLKTAFDESEHPRDHGKFSTKEGGDSKKDDNSTSQSGSDTSKNSARIDKIKDQLSNMGTGKTKKTSRFKKLIKEKEELQDKQRGNRGSDSKTTMKELTSNPMMTIAGEDNKKITGENLVNAWFETKKAGQSKPVHVDSLGALKKNLDRGDKLTSVQWEGPQRHLRASVWTTERRVDARPYRSDQNTMLEDRRRDPSEEEIESISKVHDLLKGATPEDIHKFEQHVRDLEEGEKSRKRQKTGKLEASLNTLKINNMKLQVSTK